MKRCLAILVVLALATLGLAGAATSSAGPAPRAALRDFVCQRALDPPNRSTSVTAVMRPLVGTRRLELDFDLLVSTPRHPRARLVARAPGLGVWLTPQNPTLGQLPGDVWKFDKSVLQLGAPASYQFRVAFRWIGLGRRVIGSAVLYGPPCRQAELRPDLLVRSVTVTSMPKRPSEDLYTALIANAGATAAGPFEVLFVPGDGSAPETHSVARLGAHRSRVEAFVGPACTAASAPTVTVDSAGQVDDLDRANNQRMAVCPAPLH